MTLISPRTSQQLKFLVAEKERMVLINFLEYYKPVKITALSMFTWSNNTANIYETPPEAGRGAEAWRSIISLNHATNSACQLLLLSLPPTNGN